MADKSKWGQKRTCPKCDAKFYDLNKNPIVCPVCGASFDAEEFNKHLVGKIKKAKNSANEEKISDGSEILDKVLETPDDELNLIEDASEISDDSHDMAEVIGSLDKNPLSE